MARGANFLHLTTEEHAAVTIQAVFRGRLVRQGSLKPQPLSAAAARKPRPPTVARAVSARDLPSPGWRSALKGYGGMEHLVVEVMEARELDRDSSLDPAVEIVLGADVRKTPEKVNTVNPRWHKSYFFDLREKDPEHPDRGQCYGASHIHLRVLASNLFSARVTVVGETAIALSLVVRMLTPY